MPIGSPAQDAATGKAASAPTLPRPPRVVADSRRHPPPAQNVRANSNNSNAWTEHARQDRCARVPPESKSAWPTRPPSHHAHPPAGVFTYATTPRRPSIGLDKGTCWASCPSQHEAKPAVGQRFATTQELAPWWMRPSCRRSVSPCRVGTTRPRGSAAMRWRTSGFARHETASQRGCHPGASQRWRWNGVSIRLSRERLTLADGSGRMA